MTHTQLSVVARAERQSTIKRRGFESLEQMKTICNELGLLDESGGLTQIPGFYYPDLGMRLKNNIIQAYVQSIVNQSRNSFMLEEQMFGTEALYKASGHLDQFHDPACRCEKCGERFRADHLIEDIKGIDCAGYSPTELSKHMSGIKCPACHGELGEVRQRSLMATMNISERSYFMAPETAQHIFLHYKDGLRSNGGKLPFSLHQINTASRGEVTPDLRRRRQFVQMEEELFYLASSSDTKKLHKLKVNQYWDFFTQVLGIDPDILRTREHLPSERSHYSSATIDIEAMVGGRWLEVAGLAHRGDYDLSNMENLSNKKLRVNGEIPQVIEPSVGLDRLFLAVVESAYRIEEADGKERVVLALEPALAPFKAMIAAIKPRDKAQAALANEIDKTLRSHFPVIFDNTRSIGRRYRRADQTGVPYVITVDPQSVMDRTVTIRDRDTMGQVRISIDDVLTWVGVRSR